MKPWWRNWLKKQTAEPEKPTAINVGESRILFKKENVQIEKTAAKVAAGDGESQLATNADTVHKDMGEVLNNLQTQLQFPKDFDYGVYAQAAAAIKTKWEILPGFTLKSVLLQASVLKRKDEAATLSFQLEAYVTIADIDVLVTGSIPKLKEGEDVEFVLSLKTAETLDSIPTVGLLEQLAAAAKESSSSTASATLRILYSSSSKKYLLKGFEISLGNNMSWEIIPSKLRLQRATVALVFARGSGDSFDAYVAASGRFQVGESNLVAASLRLSIENEQVLLALSCDVRGLTLLNPSDVMDALAGEAVAEKSTGALALPSDLSYPEVGANYFQTFAVIQKTADGWQLNYARTALEWGVTWNPLSFITITDVRFLALASRGGTNSSKKDQFMLQLDKLGSRNTVRLQPTIESGKLNFQGYISGNIAIEQTNLTTFARYDSAQGITIIGCSLGDAEIIPITTLVAHTTFNSNDSTELTPAEEDFNKQVAATMAPSSCPIDPKWARKPRFGRNRQFMLSVKESKLTNLAFSAEFSDKYEWKLTESIKLVKMGMAFEYELPKGEATTGSMAGFAYGQLNLSNDLQIYGMVAGVKTPTVGEFLLHLSASLNPISTLGVVPETLLKDSSLTGLTPEVDGWELDSLLPNKQSPAAILKSLSATASLRFSQTKVSDTEADQTEKYETNLLFATFSVAADGEWKIVPDITLKQLSLHARVVPKNDTLKIASSTTIQVKGILDVTVSESTYHLALIALFEKQGAFSKFSARLAASSTLSEDLANKDDQVLSISPSALSVLPAFGGKTVDVSDDVVDKDFPVRPADVMGSTKAECTMEVSKVEKASDWAISRINFSLASDKSWTIITDKVQLTGCKLTLSVNSPRSDTAREVFATASATVVIGKTLKLDGNLSFSSKSGQNLVVLAVTTKKSDILTTVSDLTGQNLGDLAPGGTPDLSDDSSLGMKITLVRETADTDKDTGYSLQSIAIQYQAGATLELPPFAVKELELELKWNKGEDGKTSVNTTVKGTIQIGDVPVGITLSYDKAKPDLLNFSMEEKEDKPLSLSILATATSIAVPSYDGPANLQPFDSAKLSSISGVFSIKSATMAETKLISLDADAVSDQKITILKIDEKISIELHHIGLHWHYEAGKASSGSIYAYLRCRTGDLTADSDYTKTDIRVEYTKSKDGDEIFKGTLQISDAELSVEHKDALAHFLPESSGKSVEIEAFGQTAWTPPSISALSVELGQIGIYLKASKAAVTQTKVDIEASITGVLKLNDFKSIDTARAQFSIGTATSAVLVASLEKTKQTGDTTTDLEDLTSQTDITKWKEVAPSSLSTLDFGTTGIVLLVDWTNSKFLLVGQVDNSSNRLAYYCKPRSGDTSKKRGYCLSLSLDTDLSKVWPDLKNSVIKDFNISRCAVEVMALGGTVGEFTKDITELKGLITGRAELADAETSFMDTASIVSSAPADTALVDGGWLFAEIDLLGERELSGALSLVVDPETTAKILLYAHIITGTQGGTTYAAQLLKEVKLFGGSVTIVKAVGVYKPAGTKVVDGKEQQEAASVTFAADLSIEGITESPLLLSVNMVSQGGTTTFGTVAASGKSITNPFTNMFNVELVSVAFWGEVIKDDDGNTDRVYGIAGGVRFGGSTSSSPADGEPGFTGGVIFNDGKPLVTYIEATNPIPISAVFSQIIQPGDKSAGTWPTNFGVITFYNATISYVPGSKAVEVEMNAGDRSTGPRTFQAGFCLSADIEFGFEKRLQANAAISRKGVKITGKYDQIIDLDFVKFSGITLALDTTESKKVYSVKSDVEFFGVKDITVELAYIPASGDQTSNRFEGTIQYKDKVNDVIGSSLKIGYQNGYWSINDWDFSKTIDDLKELAKAIENASANKGACGKIVGYVWDQAVKTKFDYHFSLPKNETKEKDGKKYFSFVVDWTYTISILDTPIKTHQFLSVLVEFPGPFSIDRLNEFLSNFVTENLPNLADALLDDPVALGDLFGLMAVQEFGKQAITSLICRGVRNEKIVKRGQEMLDEAEKDLDKNSDLAKDATVEPTGGDTSFEALTDALGTATTAVGAAEAAGAGALISSGSGPTLAGVLAKALESEKASLDKRAADAKTRVEEAKAALQGLQQKIQGYLSLSGKALAALASVSTSDSSSTTISVDWSEALPKTKNGDTFADFKGVTWEVVASLSNKVDDEKALKDHTTEHTINLTTDSEQFKTALSVFVFVRGTISVGDTTVSGEWTSAEATRSDLLPPSSVDISVAAVRSDGSQTISTKIGLLQTGTYILQFRPAADAYKDIVIRQEELTVAKLVNPLETTTSAANFATEEGWKVPASEPIYAYVKQTSKDGENVKESLETKSGQSIAFAPGPSNLAGAASGDSLVLQWDGPGESIDDFDIVVRGSSTLETTASNPVVSSGRFKVTLVLKKPVKVGDTVTVVVSSKSIPDGMINRSAQEKFTFTEASLLWTLDDPLIKARGLTDGETKFLESNKDKLAGKLLFGPPAGDKGGDLYNWTDKLLEMPDAWPAEIHNIAAVAPDLRVYDVAIVYDDKAKTRLEQKNKDFVGPRPEQSFTLESGERIIKVEVHVDEETGGKVYGIGLSTNKGRSLAPDVFFASKPVHKIEYNLPPQASGLKGWWGGAGDLIDSIGPIWG
ncbi:hypothetical protein ABW19_dt0202505 [Dactylella cylindrospora]|nr:hypothetical protein ABW19_dt0202505 [Dactylella cylindrospora]